MVIASGVAPPLRAYLTKDGAPAGEVAVEGELAAPPYILSGPRLPLLVVVARDFAKGTTVTVFTREFEPTVIPIAPLPNLIPMGRPPKAREAVPKPGEAPVAKPGDVPAATTPAKSEPAVLDVLTSDQTRF